MTLLSIKLIAFLAGGQNTNDNSNFEDIKKTIYKSIFSTEIQKPRSSLPTIKTQLLIIQIVMRYINN